MENQETILFRNVFAPTREHYIQGYRRLLFRWSIPPVVGVLASLASILLLAFLPRLILGRAISARKNTILFAVLLALIALTWLLYFWLPARSAKNTLNRQRKGYLRAVSLETAFSENGVHMLNIATEGEMHLTYDAFVYCTETEELLLLKTKGKQVLMLLKSGFSLGDEKEFKAFMRRKCPGVRFFWKKA
ncbi:MAG: YcxB family protein [Clostridia bacterium]|nr:YcxB family protein [Clostridia bacterium]